MKRFPIYNISCVDGIALPIKTNSLLDYKPVLADWWINQLSKKILFGQTLKTLPFYDAEVEELKIPIKHEKTENYYWYLFKALLKWTGQATQLNRLSIQKMLLDYPIFLQKEELICELGATYLCGYFKLFDKRNEKISKMELVDWHYYIYRYPQLLIDGIIGMQEAIRYLFDLVYQLKRRTSTTMISNSKIVVQI